MTSPMTSQAFLALLDLESLQDIFVANAIDSETLFSLEEDDLLELGIPGAEIVKILWGVQHIPALNQWLIRLNLSEHLGVFTRHQIALSEVSKLDKAALNAMGIDKLGHRKRLLAHAPTSEVRARAHSESSTLVVNPQSEAASMESNTVTGALNADSTTMPEMQATILPDFQKPVVTDKIPVEEAVHDKIRDTAPQEAPNEDAQTARKIPQFDREDIKADRAADPAVEGVTIALPKIEPKIEPVPDTVSLEDIESDFYAEKASTYLEDSNADLDEAIEALAVKKTRMLIGAVCFVLAFIIVTVGLYFDTSNNAVPLTVIELDENTKKGPEGAKRTSLSIQKSSIIVKEVHGKAANCKWLVFDSEAKSWRTTTEAIAKKESGTFVDTKGKSQAKSKKVCPDHKDGKPNPGEAIDLSFSIQNPYPHDISNVNIDLSAAHPCLDLGPKGSSSQKISKILGKAAHSLTAFRVNTGDECPVKNTLVLTLTMNAPNPSTAKSEAAKGKWTDTLTLNLASRSDGDNYCVCTGNCAPKDEDASVIIGGKQSPSKSVSQPEERKPTAQAVAKSKPVAKNREARKTSAPSLNRAKPQVETMARTMNLTPSIPRRTNPYPNKSVKVLHLQLREELTTAGLTFPDLRLVEAERVRTWGKMLRGKIKPSPNEKFACFNALTDAISKIKFNKALLNTKLRRVRKALAKVPPPKRGDMYEQLTKRLEILTQQLESARTSSDIQLLTSLFSDLEMRVHEQRKKMK